MRRNGWSFAALHVGDNLIRVAALEREPDNEPPDERDRRLSALAAARTALRYWLEWFRDRSLAALAELPDEELPPANCATEGDPLPGMPPLPPPPEAGEKPAGYAQEPWRTGA
jgi:hypothetical protein